MTQFNLSGTIELDVSDYIEGQKDASESFEKFDTERVGKAAEAVLKRTRKERETHN